MICVLLAAQHAAVVGFCFCTLRPLVTADPYVWRHGSTGIWPRQSWLGCRGAKRLCWRRVDSICLHVPQAVESPCLSILVPLLVKGLREKAAVVRKTAVIIDNMVKVWRISPFKTLLSTRFQCAVHSLQSVTA